MTSLSYFDVIPCQSHTLLAFPFTTSFADIVNARIVFCIIHFARTIRVVVPNDIE